MKRSPTSPAPSSLTRAIRYLGHYRRETAYAYGALLLATSAQLMVPLLIHRMIDGITRGVVAQQTAALPATVQAAIASRMGITLAQLTQAGTQPVQALVISGLLILVFAMVRGLFSFSQAYMGERVSQSVAFDLRNDLFSRIQRLSFSYHDRNQTGQLMVRATDDVEKVRVFIGQGLLMATSALLLMVGAIVILFTLNPRLTLVVLPILPLALGLFLVMGSVARPMFGLVQRKLSALNAILQENMAGIKVVKAFSREPEQEQRFQKAADDFLAQILKVMRLMTFLMPLVFFIANLGQAAILFFGGRQMILGTLSLGEWQTFSLYLMFVFIPVAQLGFIITQMSQASASAGRIFEITDARSDVVEAPDARLLPTVRGRVEFENVTFRYFGGGKPVLERVSFVAEPGQQIALLGRTGSGKSTIINLIPRFYDPTEGVIRIDGVDLRQVALDSLRSQIGTVLQETTLFSGTIRDNIAFGRTDAPMAEIVQVAEAAAANEFIQSFPLGYGTPVGERGVTLSGGQRQRLAIARALLLDPRILILDDSTSSVDLETEWRIQQALIRLMQGRTSFVIAQRISTVLNADQILVLDDGAIVARGRHEELLETSEIYADIYSSQLVDDSAGVTVDAAAAMATES
ncbi:MAG TPA: ABC transporter ATP-binding protein [Anaerolineales bacterium]|nr:ABC transporter ATP-binding protein [Anaerolineales bacterium]